MQEFKSKCLMAIYRDITEVKLMENMLIGQYETHRIVLVTEKEKHKMSRVIRSSSVL
jgi:hypothetical protein